MDLLLFAGTPPPDTKLSLFLRPVYLHSFWTSESSSTFQLSFFFRGSNTFNDAPAPTWRRTPSCPSHSTARKHRQSAPNVFQLDCLKTLFQSDNRNVLPSDGNRLGGAVTGDDGNKTRVVRVLQEEHRHVKSKVVLLDYLLANTSALLNAVSP